MARPQILNDELMKQICECIAVGMTVLRACAYCNISRETFYQWKIIGKEKPDSVYGLFLENIKQANARSEFKLLTDIQNDISWQSKAWLLERKFNKIWGRKNILKVEAIKENPIITYNVKDLSDEELTRLIKISDRENDE